MKTFIVDRYGSKDPLRAGDVRRFKSGDEVYARPADGRIASLA
jgi:hypothetical protein